MHSPMQKWLNENTRHMANLLLLSDYIRPIFSKISFGFIISIRFFSILFKRSKKISPIYFNYSRTDQFQNTYLEVRYQFENALWYDFKHIKRTTSNQVIVFNLKNIDRFPIQLKVYGFFRSRTYPIYVEPKYFLNSQSFSPEVTALPTVRLQNTTIQLQLKKPASKIKKFKPVFSPTKILHTTYTLNDFI